MFYSAVERLGNIDASTKSFLRLAGLSSKKIA